MVVLIVDGSVTGTPGGTYLCKVLIRLCLGFDLGGVAEKKSYFSDLLPIKYSRCMG